MKNLPNKVDGDQLTAADWTNHKNELQNVVVKSGQSYDSGSETQLSKAVMLHAMGGTTFIDSGSANTIELTPATGINGFLLSTQYSEMEGARVNFEANTTNTGATTLNIGQDTGSFLGAKKLFSPLKVDIGADTIIAGTQYEAYFDTSLDSGSGAWVLTSINSTDMQVFNNAIINPKMEISQRNTTFASVTNNLYTIDRYIYQKSGTMVHDITQDTDVPNSNYNYSMKIDCTTADTSIIAGDYCIESQFIEGYNFIPFITKTATLSFWVKATKTGTYCVSFINNGNDRSYVSEYTVDVTNTWEKKSITLTFNYSGGTWDYVNGTGIRIGWCLACGSTFQTTADSWQTGQFYGTSNQVNATDSIVNDFFITGIQFELGVNASDLEYRFFTDELYKCMRYYEKTYDLSVVPGTLSSLGGITQFAKASTDTGFNTGRRWVVPKRATPSITIISNQTGSSGFAWSTGDVADRAVTAIQGIGIFGYQHFVTTTTGSDTSLQYHEVVDAELT